MFFRLNPACCVTALNRSFPIIIADNAARITNPAAAQRRNIARRITVFNGSPVIADNAASDAFSLHASADHGAVEHLTFVVFANNCGGLPFHRNLRIAKDQILNCSVKVAKQPRIAVRIRRTGQIADGVILSVEYARKRITDLRRVRFECADGRPVGVYRQIDVVHQQHRFAALAVARVHLVGELFELLGRGDVNRGLAAEHPARQFACTAHPSGPSKSAGRFRCTSTRRHLQKSRRTAWRARRRCRPGLRRFHCSPRRRSRCFRPPSCRSTRKRSIFHSARTALDGWMLLSRSAPAPRIALRSVPGRRYLRYSVR